MLKALFVLFVLFILIGSSIGLYFLWRPKETCDWQDRGCNYAQGCMNQACIDTAGNITRVQCLPVERCKEAPTCEKWQDIGCDSVNQCMKQECVNDKSKYQCVDSAKCQTGPVTNCPPNTVLKGDYCYTVCPAGTVDLGDYCKINISNFTCPQYTISTGNDCYKRKYDPKTGNCIPEWIKAGCDPIKHELYQINSCTGEKKLLINTSKVCCPVWKPVGCDTEKYCTKLIDDCGVASDTCVCGTFAGKEYTECCPKYEWSRVGGLLKNKGMNDYARALSANGYNSFAGFNKDQPIVFQPNVNGNLYMALSAVFSGKVITEYGYLTLGNSIIPCEQCGDFQPPLRVDKAYSITFTKDPKTVWAYNRITGEIVDNIVKPTIKISVIAMTNQEGDNPLLVMAAIPYSGKGSDYDVWLHEPIIS